MSIESWREEIDRIDSELLRLLNMRARIAIKVAALKKAAALPLNDKDREQEVLEWTASGKSAWEIGMILGIAKRTVDTHAQSISRKLGAANRAQAVAIAMRERLINI